MKLVDIPIYETVNIINEYLIEKHPINSNGFVIRISRKMPNNFTKRNMYIVNFPKINDGNKMSIIQLLTDKWSEYIFSNIVKNCDMNEIVTVLSINPILVPKKFNDVIIQYSGTITNPENLVRSISMDIINRMNKHLIEQYMDEMHPEIDILDSEKKGEIDNIDFDDIYNKYKYADVYVPITLTSNIILEKITFYLSGTILTNAKMSDIINDVRICLDTDDMSEIFEYDKDDIVYKFGSNKIEKSFNIITNAQVFDIINV